MTLSAKMHTGKSIIYLPCLSYETAKVHVISVKGQVLLQSLVNTKDIKLPYFLCFNFLDFFVGLNDTGEEYRCHLLFFNRNSWRILMTNVVFLSKIMEEFWEKVDISQHMICHQNYSRISDRKTTFVIKILQEFLLKNSRWQRNSSRFRSEM